VKGDLDKKTYPVRLRRRRLTLDRLPGLIIRIVRDTFRSMAHARASEAAASIAYYGLFSLFPLVIIMIVIGSFFLQRSLVQQEILDWVKTTIPVSETLITENLQQVLDRRGTFSFIALASLLWSASGVFTTLVIHVNRAWPEAHSRGYVKNRVMAFSLVAGLVSALVLLLLITTLMRLILSLSIPFIGQMEYADSLVWKTTTRTLPFLSSFLAAWVIYHWVPNLAVNRIAAFAGALTTTILWRLLSNLFTWYLSSSLNSYELVYGSLGTIVALMVWAYLTSWITLFGAHLTSTVSRRLHGYLQAPNPSSSLVIRNSHRIQ